MVLVPTNFVGLCCLLLLFLLSLFRAIYDNGDIYEGGYNMSLRHGKGEYEFYENGRRRVGQYVDNKKEGEFKIYDQQGNMRIMHFKDGEIVEE